MQSTRALDVRPWYGRRFLRDVTAPARSSDRLLTGMIGCHGDEDLFAQKDAGKREEQERQRFTFLFLDTPCVSAAPLQCMGVSSQKDYILGMIPKPGRLSHRDLMK